MQDLVGRAFQLHIVLDNRHKAVGSNSSRYLYSDCVLGSSPELFDLEVLLEPLEEQLYLPTVLVEVGYLLGCQVHRISQEHELTVLLLIVVSDESEIIGIVLAAVIDSQFNLSVREYVLGHPPLPLDTFVLQVRLGSDNEERLHPLYAEKLLEVVVTTVEDVVSTCLIRNFWHGLGIMD